MKDFYTVQEIARELGVTRQRVYQMIHAGFIRATLAATRVTTVVTAEELERLKAERSKKGKVA